MLRLFVAIPISADLRNRLARLPKALEGALWVAPEQLHLTLRFIGNTPEQQLPRLEAALRSVRFSPMALRVTGLGTFPNLRQPRILFARVAPAAALMSLRAGIEDALGRAGIEEDDRPFRPHITLARLRTPAPAAVRRFVRNTEIEAVFVAAEVRLYASELQSAGARHRVIADFRPS